MIEVTELYMNEIFKQECEEAGIPFEEFPFDFAENSEMNWGAVIKAVMWILKKRQDKRCHYNWDKISVVDSG
jgi:hypothetical protein